MIRFILNRLVTLAGLLFLLSVITFWVNVRIYGIDLKGQALPEYAKYMQNLLNLNLGTSDITGQPVTDLISGTLPSTLGLLLSSFIIALITGTVCGSTAALTLDRKTSTVITDVSIFVSSVPVFLISVFLIIAVSLSAAAIPSSDELSYFYDVPDITGIKLIDILLMDSDMKEEILVNCLLHLVLPAITISVLPAAELTRITRNSLRNVMRQHYMQAALSRCWSIFYIVLFHGLRNALPEIFVRLPVLINIYFTAIVIAEFVFNWPGTGNLLITAAQDRDRPVIMGIFLFTAAVLLTVNSVFSLLARFTRPEITEQAK